MVSNNLNLLVKNIFKLYLPVNRRGKKPWGKMSCIMSDVVSNFASMRMFVAVAKAIEVL